jgi:hypothetical protein
LFKGRGLGCLRAGTPAVSIAFLTLLLFPGFLRAAEIRGRVVNDAQGEPLARVQVSVLETQRQTTTASDGTFVITNLPPGDYTLRVSTVGYRLLTVKFSLAADETAKEFDIVLAPDNFRRTDKVEVHGDIFQGPDSLAVYETNLTSPEIRETATVLVDDPFRSIQTLPGVSASGNNDFFAQTSIMGASYEDTSIYIDGILVPAPFHGTNVTQGATISIFSSDTMEDIKLLPVAYPEKYGDSVGAALDLTTREGSRDAPIFRASAGLAESEFLGEGELGTLKRGSWLASARKSYLGYLVNSRLNESSADVSFYDGDVKLAYDVTRNQSVNFYGIGGHTFYQLVNPSYTLDPDDIHQATDKFMLGRVGWRWALDPNLLLEAHGAYFQQPASEENIDYQSLFDSHHAEWVGGSSAVWNWRKEQVLEGGWMARRVNDSALNTFYSGSDTAYQTLGEGGAGWKNDGYLEQSSSLFNSKLHLAGGLRVDTAQGFDLHPVSPQLSAALQLASQTQLQLGFGRYNQFDFPTFPEQALKSCAFDYAFLQTADHYMAGLEQRFGENTRAKLVVFDRQNASSYDETNSAGCPEFRPTNGFVTDERDYSRGAQIVIQSRTANRLSGWIGYTLAYSRFNEPGLGANPSQPIDYPTLDDQRHTVNLFANYRLTPTINLGGKFLFGSGFPVPGVTTYSLPPLSNYQRLDVRAEKDWALTRCKFALYVEVLNLTDHDNRRYFYTSVNANGTPNVATGEGLPITPTAGVAFEF